MRIKGFNKNLCCRDMQFEVGNEYKIEINKPLKLCSNTVFHYCDSLQKVHKFYSCEENENNRFCEIEVLGEEITDGVKCGSNHIKIVREIVGEELNNLKGLVNGNTGLFNSGYRNSGNSNSGNRNSGNRNSGYSNSGDGNSGDSNSGDGNSGDSNSGNRNSGNSNSGDGNSGDSNSGNRNSGYSNSGNRNSGNRNSGYSNSGDGNSGDSNSGNRNSGDGNSGIFNSCDYSSGVFCNKNPNIRIFNIETDMTMEEFLKTKYAEAIYSSQFNLTEWINYTNEEMEKDPDKKLIGGYLKEYSYKEACANWWAEMSEENKKIIKSMPNFDKEIFKDITGIEV